MKTRSDHLSHRLRRPARAIDSIRWNIMLAIKNWLFVAILMFIPCVSQAAESNIVQSPRDTVSLVSATKSVNGQAAQLGLLFRMTAGWHIYWSDPGDAGEPPSIEVTSPKGAKPGPFAWPSPKWLVIGPVGDYVETGTVLLPFKLTLPHQITSSGSTIVASANWLVCSTSLCVPEQGVFKLHLPGGAGKASGQAPLFSKASADLPRPSPYRATIAPDGRLAIIGAGLTRQSIKSAHFFPDSANAIANATPQTLGFIKGGFTLALKPKARPSAHPIAGVLEITDPSGQTQSLTIAAKDGVVGAAKATTPFLVWIGAALLGGLILNLMPCVFPVLAIKAMAVAKLGHDDRRRARRDAIAYTLGAIIAMLGLGGSLLLLREGGAVLGWGFQFQSPIFIAVMAWLIFIVGLNFAGVFEITGLENIGSGLVARGGMTGSFATGLLAVVVATPCTAPFMGGAIAAALAAPTYIGLSIFASLGFGIALPFVLIAAIPGIGRALPKPGAWMDVLRQFLAFPMFATAIWLLWVMTAEAGASGALIVGSGAVLIAFALWLIRFKRTLPRGIAVLAAIATLLLLFKISPASGHSDSPAGPALSGAVDFSPVKLASLREEGKPVFVDMSAAWCITCQVNERVALEPRAIRQLFVRRNITLMQGNWTRRAPDITRFLAAHGRDGVPLYVYYPPNHGASVILPQILTPHIVAQAVRK